MVDMDDSYGLVGAVVYTRSSWTATFFLGSKVRMRKPMGAQLCQRMRPIQNRERQSERTSRGAWSGVNQAGCGCGFVGGGRYLQEASCGCTVREGPGCGSCYQSMVPSLSMDCVRLVESQGLRLDN